MFFNNHTHSEYSNSSLGFSDVAIKLPDLIQKAYDLGLAGINLSDHESISGHIKAVNYYNKMNKERPFTLSLGNEIYLMRENEDRANRDENGKFPYYHFILTALDDEGHQQLRLLSTRAWLRAYKKFMYRRPTYYSDLEEIVKPNPGHIVASSACLGSRIDKLILTHNYEKVYEEIQILKDIFGEDNFYLEVQPAKKEGNEQSIVNRAMWEIALKTNTKIIPTTDAHYLSKDTYFIHKIYLNSQDGDRESEGFYDTAYLMDENELKEYLKIDFSDIQIKQLLEWSMEIPERVKGYNLKHNPIIPEIPLEHIPQFKKQDTFSKYYKKYPNFSYYSKDERNIHEKYFFYQIEKGLKEKILNHSEKSQDIEKYIARLDEEWKELIIISKQLNTSMASYYSTMSTIIDLIWEANSLAMPGRGSSVGFLTCYILEITQIDPVPLGDYMPSWRHLNHERGVELPDIDNDSEASKKKAIVNKIKDFFGEDKVLNIITFSKISSKTAIQKACKGLNVPDEEAAYFKSLIPINRGKVAKLKDCIYGNEEKNIYPIKELISGMKKYPNLIEAALGLEGLITNRGVHAAGVIICNEPYSNYISAMRSAEGDLITCYDLWDAEEAGCIKFDMLTTACADKIHSTLNWLLKENKITWEGSLKATYYKWLHPDTLLYDNPEMWNMISSIYSVFQFDTPISSQALSATKPKNVLDLSAANSLLRLMPDNADETPINKYIRYKNDEQQWFKDTSNFGLNKEEQNCLWKYIKDAHGLADSQEKIMRISMDPCISGYSLKEANALRKSIAKKDDKLQEQAKQQFFEYGAKQGTRKIFLDYIWNVVFSASMGYSFSQLHSYAYSIIALQELNLNYLYSPVYWNCACLSTEASGITDEGEKSSGTDYGEIAKAIYKMKKHKVDILPPSINNSDIEFTPIEKDNIILYGLSGISSINGKIAQEIIENRPYKSFKHFYYTFKNKENTLIKRNQMINLIKAQCFNEFNHDPIFYLKWLACYEHNKKDELTLANLQKSIQLGISLPHELVRKYKFKNYVLSKEFFYCKDAHFKTKKHYIVEPKFAFPFLEKHYLDKLVEEKDYYYQDDTCIVIDKSLEKVMKEDMELLKKSLEDKKIVEEFNLKIIQENYNSITKNTEDINKWALETICFYPNNEHELKHINFDAYNISKFSELPEEPVFIERTNKNFTWKQYELSRICGVVLNRNDDKHLVDILTPDNETVTVKFYDKQFAYYKKTIMDNIKGKDVKVDMNWFTRGQLLLISGYRRGKDNFVAKKYKNSIFQHPVILINKVNKDQSLQLTLEKYKIEE